MRKSIVTIVLLIIVKLWAFAYDFTAVNQYGDELCYSILSDTTVQIVSENVTSGWNSNTQNYTKLRHDELYIPDTVRYNGVNYCVCQIGDHAFSCIHTIKTLHIPKTITSIADVSSLSYYNNISRYIVDEENPNFMSVDGVIYTKDGRTLYSYPHAKPDSLFQVLDGVKNIGMLSFHTEGGLKIIEMPLSLETVEPVAFISSTIKEIIFQDNVQTIETMAFSGLPNLRHLVFGNRLMYVNLAYLAHDMPITVECRTLAPPVCAFLDDGNSYISSSTLFVPRSSVYLYQQKEGWNKFGAILPIEPPVVVGVDETTVSWVQNFSATGYVWTLYSDEQQTNMVMELTFDQRGYLTDIVIGNLAPSNVHEANAPMLRMTAEDNDDERRFAEYYSFTIRSLSPNTTYYYTRQALAGEEVIDEEQGSFTTLNDSTTDFEQYSTPGTSGGSTKVLNDGRIEIRSHEKVYTVQGVKIE